MLIGRLRRTTILYGRASTVSMLQYPVEIPKNERYTCLKGGDVLTS